MVATPALDMLRLLGGFQISQALYVVARTAIADQLVAGPVPIARLAEFAGVREDMLRRVVRSLAAESVFIYDADEDIVGLGLLGPTLVSESPGSVRNVALMWMQTHYLAFAELEGTLHDGVPAAEHAHGRPFYAWLGDDPARTSIFSAAMADLMRVMRRDALASLSFDGVRRVVDVGGADGTVLGGLATRHLHLRGTVFDLPHVVAAAPGVLRELGVGERIDTAAGDAFVAVPPDADCYLACGVLQGWNDEQASHALARIHEAAAPDTRLVIVDMVVGESSAPQLVGLLDLTMMAMSGGRGRTARDWQNLLTAAGFRLDQISPHGPVCVIEASPQP